MLFTYFIWFCPGCVLLHWEWVDLKRDPGIDSNPVPHCPVCSECSHFANGQQTVCRRRHFDIRNSNHHVNAAIRIYNRMLFSLKSLDHSYIIEFTGLCCFYISLIRCGFWPFEIILSRLLNVVISSMLWIQLILCVFVCVVCVIFGWSVILQFYVWSVYNFRHCWFLWGYFVLKFTIFGEPV